MKEGEQNTYRSSPGQKNEPKSRWADSCKRLHIVPGAVTHLPEGCLWVKVIEGAAWITVDHRDIIIRARSQRQIPVRGVGLVSGLLDQPLVLDIFQKAGSSQPGEMSTSWQATQDTGDKSAARNADPCPC